MLIKFKIKNFRSIKDEVVLDMQATSDKTRVGEATFENEKADIALLKSVAIYGANASGKSNILNAFDSFKFILMNSLNYPNNQNPLQHFFFKLDKDCYNKDTEFEITFLMNNEIYIYGFSFNQDGFNKEYLIKNKKIDSEKDFELFKRENQAFITREDLFKESSEDLQNQTHKKSLHLSLLNQRNGEITKQIFETIFKMNFINCINQKQIGYNITTQYYLQNKERADNIIKSMKSMDRSIDNFVIKQNKKHISQIPNIPEFIVKDELQKNPQGIININEIYLERKDQDGNIIKFDFDLDESEGTKQYFALMGIMYNTLERGGVLFLDEFNASLHPIMCKYIVEIFNNKMTNPNNAQLIFATHDTILLDKDLMRRDQIYFAQKDKNIATELFSLADISERKEGVSFAKRYLEGRYGAIPYIKELEELLDKKIAEE